MKHVFKHIPGFRSVAKKYAAPAMSAASYRANPGVDFSERLVNRRRRRRWWWLWWMSSDFFLII